MSEESSDMATEATEGIENQDEGLVGGEEQVQSEAPPKELEKQIQNMKRKFLLKVDGEEFEEEFDLADEESLKRELQLARAAKKRMAEAQDAKRKAFELVQGFEKDPASILKRLGPKGYEYAEQVLLEKLQNEMMSPEQRKLAEYEAKIKQYEDLERSQKEEQEKAQQQALETKHAEHYQKVIIEALDKSGLPKTPDMAKRAAYLLQKNLELGLDLDASDLVSEMKKDVLSMVKGLVGSAEGDQLLEILGQDTAKKIRRHDIQTIKQKQLNGVKPIYQGSPAPQTSKKKGYVSFDEWQEEVSRRLQSQE
jgi:hypothetical protein